MAPCRWTVEPNEHPKDTVKREIVEELGTEASFMMETPLFLTVTKTVGQTAGHTDISLWYVLEGSSSVSYAFNIEEFARIRWFYPAEIPYNQSDPHMKRCIEKLCSLSILEKKELWFTDV